MTRIVRTAYRYKRPPKRKKPVTIEVPVVITAATKRRKVAAEAKAALKASIQMAPGESSTPTTSRPASAAAAKSAIVTVRQKAARILPPGLLPETPEEHQRRGDAADALFREVVRRVTAKKWLRQKNLWATSGSGSLPRAWYSAVSVTWNVRKP
jgi:hypothetical protein